MMRSNRGQERFEHPHGATRELSWWLLVAEGEALLLARRCGVARRLRAVAPRQKAGVKPRPQPVQHDTIVIQKNDCKNACLDVHTTNITI